MGNPLFALFTYWYEAGAPTTLQEAGKAVAVQLVPAVDQSYGMVTGIALFRQYAGMLLPLVAIDTLLALAIVVLTIWLFGKLIGQCAGIGWTCGIMVAICVAIAVSVWALVTLIVVSRREELRSSVLPPPPPSVLSTALDALWKLNPMG